MNGLIGITGASGFIGEALVKHLSLSGYHGIAISRQRSVPVPHGWHAVDRKLFLSNPENYEVRCIIHLEVKHHVYKESSSSADEFDEVNVGNTRDYLRAAARCGCRQFIYFSSIKAIRLGAGENSEDLFEPGRCLYGRSKWNAEALVRAWVGEDVSRWGVILRPAVVYGPGNTANIYSMLDAIAKKRFMYVKNGSCKKSVVSINNVCSAVEFLLSKTTAGLQVFNLVDPNQLTIKEIAQLMAKELKVPEPRINIPLPIAYLFGCIGESLLALGVKSVPISKSRLSALMQDSVVSGKKLTEYGFRSSESTPVGIQRLVGWYLNNK